MGCLSGLARLLLVAINIVFMLIGLSLAVVGFILRFGRSIYEPFLETGIDQLKKVLDDTSLASFAVDDIDLGQVVQSIAIGLIVGGLVLVALSFMGCCGACYKVDFMLWLYAIVIIVCVVLEAVAIGLLYGKPDLVKDNVKKSIEEYKGLSSSEIPSVGWNIVMIQFKCCGVDNYHDFDDAAHWNKTVHSVTLVTPIACCKSLPSGTSPSDFACATSFDATTNNGNEGCFEKLWDESFARTEIAVPVLVVCGIIQFAFIAFAIYIAKSGDNNSVSPI